MDISVVKQSTPSGSSYNQLENERGRKFLSLILLKKKNFGNYSRSLTVKEVFLSQLFDRFYEMQPDGHSQSHKQFLEMILTILGDKREQAEQIMQQTFSGLGKTTKEFEVKVKGIGLLLRWPEFDDVKLVDLSQEPEILSTEEKLKGISQLFRLRHRLFLFKHTALSNGLNKLEEFSTNYSNNINQINLSREEELKKMESRRRRNGIKRIYKFSDQSEIDQLKESSRKFHGEVTLLIRVYRVQGERVLQELHTLAHRSGRSQFAVGKFFEAHRSYTKNLINRLSRMKNLIEEHRSDLFLHRLVDLSPATTGIPLPKAISRNLRGISSLKEASTAINSLQQELLKLTNFLDGINSLEKVETNFLNQLTSTPQKITDSTKERKNNKLWSREKIDKYCRSRVSEKFFKEAGSEKNFITMLKYLQLLSYQNLYEVGKLIKICSKATQNLGRIDSLETLWKEYAQEAKVEDKLEDYLNLLHELDEPSQGELQRKIKRKKRTKPLRVEERVEILTNDETVEEFHGANPEEALLAIAKISRRQLQFFRNQSVDLLQQEEGKMRGVCYGEMAYHYHHLQTGLRLYVESILNKKLHRIAQIVPMMLLDCHVIIEQELKERILAASGYYSQQHDLVALSMQVEKAGELPCQEMSNGLCWARYSSEYLSVVSRDRLPIGLSWMETANELLKLYLKGGRVSTSMRKRLKLMNAQLFETLSSFYEKEPLNLLKEAVEKSGFRGKFTRQKRVDLSCQSSGDPKLRVTCQTARYHLARLTIAKELLFEYAKHPQMQGTLWRNLLTHAKYGVEKMLAMRVLVRGLGEHRGHNLKKFSEMLGLSANVDDLNLGNWLHYPTYCNLTDDHLAGRAVLDSTLASMSKSVNSPSQQLLGKTLQRTEALIKRLVSKRDS